ncbi:unnamed protein product [Porites evermanni]|uniref:Polynucleotide 5'-hydroxyl-kinase NOL9 n=1 Tax=Porites evermanni TaxID=104178 RepID=A0ABN8S9P2_9CNID|nr:unnamed protein product [Porites evermanni]
MPVGRKRKFATANSTGHQQETRGKRSRKTEDSAVTQTSVAVRKGTCRPSKREKKGKKEKAKECIVISSSSEDEESAINKKAVKDSIGTARKPTCRRSKRQKDGVKKGGYAGKSALISTRLNVKRTAAKKAERGGNATTKKATGRRSQRKKKDAKKSSEESRVMPASLNVKSVLPLSGSLRNACLFFLARGQRVCIKGLALIKTLIGSVEVYGSVLRPDHDPVEIFCPSTSSLAVLSEHSEENSSRGINLKRTFQDVLQNQPPEVMKKALVRSRKSATVLLMKSLQTVETNFVCSIQRFHDIFSSNLGKVSSLDKIEMSLKKKTAPLGFIFLEPWYPARCRMLTVPDQWKVAASSVCQTKMGMEAKAPVILICGGKDIGKSTFARYLTNTFLNRQNEPYFLECDVGQSEFTPPGLISLNRVSSPLLGPPFTHLRQPERSVFFGDVSPKDRPGFYIQCIYNVYQTYADKYRNKIPLIINTQGWVKGMGVPLLLDVIRVVKPTHIVQFNYATKENANKNLPKMTAELFASTPGWAFTVEEEERPENNSRWLKQISMALCLTFIGGKKHPKFAKLSKFKASDHRTLALLSYFSRTKANISHCEGRSSLAQTSLLSCVPYSVPWSCVGIHVMHTEISWNEILYAVNASVVGLARCASEEMYRRGDCSTPWCFMRSPITECIGLGIVRNIDPVEKLLFVLTPLGLDDLKQVNTLLKGNLEIPAALLLSTKQSNAPYISTEFSYDLRGAGARKVRYNLMRRQNAC